MGDTDVVSHAKEGILSLLQAIEPGPLRDSLKETPDRFVKAYLEMTSGYREDPKHLLKTFDEVLVTPDEMILVSDIAFTSLCEHHLLPFSGLAHVAYIPASFTSADNATERIRIVGLSKISRLVDCFAKRLQVQERLTRQITDSMSQHLQPKGVGCVIVADHSCVSCRGVRKSGTRTITSSLWGEFEKQEVRNEFLTLIQLKGK